MRILIADDHAMVRSGLRNFLYSYEWMEPVGEAKDGFEAVAFCSKHEVDVVLMDMIMPVMDGPELIRAIREREDLRAVKLVLMSATDETDGAACARAIGSAR